VRKPDLLSFYIASKIPVSEETRQELLEIDGISYRLRREIDLLETFDLVRCKTCKVINGIESSKFLLWAYMCYVHMHLVSPAAYEHMMTPAWVFFFFLENYWLAMNLRQNPALSCEHKLKHAVLFLLKYTFSSFFFSIQIVISRRSDMLVMSSEGPLGAYVNPLGYVHEIMTLQKANGLALIGRATAEYSWFPGYGLSFYP
jgi:hypothetical protein